MWLFSIRTNILFLRWAKAEANEHVAADGTVSIIRLDGIGKRISGDVSADAGFDITKQIDIARVADGVGANAERAAVQNVEILFDLRLVFEQFVFIH